MICLILLLQVVFLYMYLNTYFFWSAFQNGFDDIQLPVSAILVPKNHKCFDPNTYLCGQKAPRQK